MDKSFNKIIKSQVKLMVLSVIAIILVCASASYALFQTSHKNTRDQVISIGTIATGITGTPITLSDIYPMEESELTNDYPTYEFTISNTNGVDNYDVNYELFLTDNTSTLKSGSEASTYANYEALSTSEYQYINYRLDSNAVSNLGAIYNSETGKMTLQTGELLRNKSENHTIRFWLSTSAPKNVQGKVLSLVMNLTSTPKLSEKVIRCYDRTDETIEITCPDAANLEVGDKIAIGEGDTAQYFRYIRTTDASDTEHLLNECGEGTGTSVACADTSTGQLKLLAEYNLNVGDLKYPNNTKPINLGLQDSHVNGEAYGNIAFGSSNQYSTSYVKTSTDAYTSILNNEYFGGLEILSGSAITYEELENLKNNLGNPSWIYTTSYWSRSIQNNNLIWLVSSNGQFGYTYNTDDACGVRPVIEVSSTDFNTYKR